MKVSESDLELVRHTVGAKPHIPKRQWGFRNHFCSGTSGKDYEGMLRLEKAGFMVRQERSEEWGGIYFYATVEGCKAIGLKAYQIKKVNFWKRKQ